MSIFLDTPEHPVTLELTEPWTYYEWLDYIEHVLSTPVEIITPVCPFCHTDMVRAHIQDDDGTWAVRWLCDCEPDPAVYTPPAPIIEFIKDYRDYLEHS